MKKIRTLKAEEIDVRVQSVRDGKANMLLYITSRSASDLLDETYGMANWKIEYKDVAGQIYGRLSVYDEESDRWVVREDTGEESNVSAEKGLASDILKRCIVRLGVTELYSSPKIQFPDDGYNNTGYKVSEIEYDERRNITHIVIVNRFGKEAFRWSKDCKQTYTPSFKATVQTPNDSLEWKEDEPAKENTVILTEFCTQMKNNGVDKTQLKKFYDYYLPKANGWKGQFNPQRLLENWLNKAA